MASPLAAPGNAVVNFTMTVGPYDKYQTDPTATYVIESNYSEEKTFYEIFRFGDEINPNQRTVTKGNHKIASKTKYNGSVVIPTKALLGDSGMKITIELYLSDGTRLKTNNCYIYPKKPETINPITYYSSTYTCRDTRASFISNKVFKILRCLLCSSLIWHA